MIVIHNDDHQHALKEIDGAAAAVASDQKQAFRILKYDSVFQRDLSIKCGFYVCDLHDIHTLKDVKFVEERTKRDPRA